MTPDEINAYKIEGSTDPNYYVFETANWLKEIALQLARINERLDNGEMNVNTFEQ